MNIQPIKLVDIELSQPIESYTNLQGYAAIQALVRLHGVPIGSVRLPLRAGACSAAQLSQVIIDQLDRAILRHLVDDGLAAAAHNRLRLAELLETPHPASPDPFPLITVAVCTRDRTDELATCLAALRQIDYPAFEVLVVDNAPSNDATEWLVRTHYPEVRYVCEMRPGLDWARNRAILAACGEIIAYTDDDVVVDSGWLRALAPLFTQNPEVMAVTGLVAPYELETPAQILFERYGGFGRGYTRKWYRLPPDRSRRERYHIGAGALGTGANMAYRRSIFTQIGMFDTALDVGTPTNGGGDLEMFFRILVEGHTLVYEPAALVRHRHRRDYAMLRTQLANNGIGFYSFLSRSARAYPRERHAIVELGFWWLWRWNLRRLLISYLRPSRFPRDLILAELRGSMAGLVRYRQAQRVQLRIEQQLGAQ